MALRAQVMLIAVLCLALWCLQLQPQMCCLYAAAAGKHCQTNFDAILKKKLFMLGYSLMVLLPIEVQHTCVIVCKPAIFV